MCRKVWVGFLLEKICKQALYSCKWFAKRQPIGFKSNTARKLERIIYV